MKFEYFMLKQIKNIFIIHVLTVKLFFIFDKSLMTCKFVLNTLYYLKSMMSDNLLVLKIIREKLSIVF